MRYIERVVRQDKLLAVIIRDNFAKEGIHFLTLDNFSQMCGACFSEGYAGIAPDDIRYTCKRVREYNNA